jgi:hypothetical protein
VHSVRRGQLQAAADRPFESRRFDDPRNFSQNALMLQHNANRIAPPHAKAAAIFCMNISN